MNSYKFLGKSVFIFLLFFLASYANAQNQQNENTSPVQKLALDPKIRFGQLDNGLTYYIRHNESTKGQADFYFVHNVGSMQEEDHQRGYMHFLEHMAIRNSKNFPLKNGIKGYSEREGLKTELSTGFDETIYKLINVPVHQQSIIDSCLLILHDWTSFLLFDDEMIEEEREVAREEWRQKHTMKIRLLEKQLPVMYPKSKYGARLPIGILGIIENFNKNDFLSFYKQWYIPEYQAIIISGDVDVVKIEAKIKKIFSDLQKSEKQKPKELYVVTDNDFPIISIAKDKEEKNTTLIIYYKLDPPPLLYNGTIADITFNYSKEVISQVMNERFSELLKNANLPFTSASAEKKNYFISKTKDAWTTTCILKSNDFAGAMNLLVEETEKLRKTGITDKEYERAKTKILKNYESDIIITDKTPNNQLINKYVNHFLNDTYAPGNEIEYGIIKQISEFFDAEAINNYIRSIFKDYNYGTNIVISLTGPEDEKIDYPNEEELLKLYIHACEEVIGEDNEEIDSIDLIQELPKPGKIISETEDDLFGTTNFKLSNGVNVILKKTEFKPNQILMSAISKGGTTQFKNEKDIWNIKMLNTIIRANGFGDINAAKLKRYLDINNVSYNSGLTESAEVLNGEATTSSIKTLFEVIYLQFSRIRSEREAYLSSQESIKNQLDNLNANIETIFSDTLFSIAFNNNPRTNRLKANDLDKIDYNRIIEMYKERFADASNFVFVFTGDIEKESIKPLIEQYLATLPALYRIEKADESQIVPYQKGEIVSHFSQNLTESVSKIALLYTGKIPYDLKNLIITQSLNTILESKFYEKLLPYGFDISNIFTEVDLYDFPEGRSSIQIFIDATPDTQNSIIEIVKAEIKKIAEEGPNDEILRNSINRIFKKRYEILQTNDYWLNILSAYYSSNFDSHSNYEEILNSIKMDDIKEFTKELINQGNLIEVVMYPE